MTPRSIRTDGPPSTLTSPALAQALALADDLVDAWGSWGATMTSDASRIAFVSDRRGTPEVWVQGLDAAHDTAVPIALTPDPVIQVTWSADDRWLACLVATGGGVRTQVWVVRPDGSDARLLAGGDTQHAELGPWTRSGHRVVVTVPGSDSAQSYLADPTTGDLFPLALGELIQVLDLSVEERLLILRDGPRGQQFCVIVDRLTDTEHPLLPEDVTGATEVALIRPAPPTGEGPLVAYLVTEAGRERRELVALPIGPNGWRGTPVTLAARDDAELEALDADDAGTLLLAVWNAGGRSEVELIDTASGERMPVPDVPGQVVTTPVLTRGADAVVVTIEGPERPREIWRLDTGALSWQRVTAAPAMPGVPLVVPTLERFPAADGLELSGWLYRAPGARVPGPALLHLHGGPEAQERPTFSAQHQAIAAAGITVFAPNVRGSSGFGRTFVHADDGEGRWGSIADVIAARDHLVATGVAAADRVGVTGRSYGGYLTLAALAFHPDVFAAGIDICGMSDLPSFYRETEPWIAAAAVTKYGHPRRDRALLRAISPLRRAKDIVAPLLVVHGEFDTNVPIGQAQRIVTALRKQRKPVEYLELAGEGHEYRAASSRRLLVERMLRFLTQHL